MKRVAREYGRVDILVNNAAFQLHAADIEQITEEHFDTTLKTNLYGYFHMTQACLPLMGYGSAIVNTGSVTGLLGNKSLLDYSTSKGGIHAFTRSLEIDPVVQFGVDRLILAVPAIRERSPHAHNFALADGSG